MEKDTHSTNEAGKESIVQFIKFALIGVMNTAVDFIVFTLLANFSPLGSTVSNVVSYSAGVGNSYLFNTMWTFRHERRRDLREFISFVLVNLVSLGVSTLIIYLCEACVFANGTLADAFASGIFGFVASTRDAAIAVLSKIVAIPITLVVNFVCSKLFVFKRQNA